MVHVISAPNFSRYLEVILKRDIYTTVTFPMSLLLPRSPFYFSIHVDVSSQVLPPHLCHLLMLCFKESFPFLLPLLCIYWVTFLLNLCGREQKNWLSENLPVIIDSAQQVKISELLSKKPRWQIIVTRILRIPLLWSLWQGVRRVVVKTQLEICIYRGEWCVYSSKQTLVLSPSV